MPLPNHARSRRFLVALLCGLLAAGCAGAPAQQMSDARQAIRAAEQAGAQQHAPELRAEAQQLIERARVNLQKGKRKEISGHKIL